MDFQVVYDKADLLFVLGGYSKVREHWNDYYPPQFFQGVYLFFDIFLLGYLRRPRVYNISRRRNESNVLLHI